MTGFLEILSKDLPTVIGLATFAGVILTAYISLKKPDIKFSQEIAVAKEGCVLKHQYLNKDISDIQKILTKIADNDLKHIELSIGSINERFARMEGILEERFQTKIK